MALGKGLVEGMSPMPQVHPCCCLGAVGSREALMFRGAALSSPTIPFIAGPGAVQRRKLLPHFAVDSLC